MNHVVVAGCTPALDCSKHGPLIDAYSLPGLDCNKMQHITDLSKIDPYRLGLNQNETYRGQQTLTNHLSQYDPYRVTKLA
jgi:hypothetical protein